VVNSGRNVEANSKSNAAGPKQVVLKIQWALGALVCGAALYLAGARSAPLGLARGSDDKAAAKPQGRIAFVNLAYVLKNYKKVVDVAEELRKSRAELEASSNEKRSKIDALQQKLIESIGAGKKGFSEADMESMKKLAEEIKVMQAEFRKAWTPKNEANQVDVYQDIRKAVAKYAKANDIEVVLQFQDGLTEQELNMPLNIRDILQTRACIPIYYPNAVDISEQVSANLNEAYAKKGGS
jgi:Skp family chaperone for outer membrane proteins